MTVSRRKHVKMADYKISPQAEEDLYRIWLYGLETWGITKADSYLAALSEQFQKIADTPILYQQVDEIKEGYRRCVFRNKESIYYRIQGEDIEIMSIIGSQDLDEWL